MITIKKKQAPILENSFILPRKSIISEFLLFWLLLSGGFGGHIGEPIWDREDGALV